MQIAIVGNDSKFCLLLQDLLEQQGHRVALLPDAAKAFARLSTEPSHLLVIDGVASADEAKQLVRSLRSHAATQRLPILSVNAKAAAGDVVDLLDAGADDYLVKPFHGQIFLARVRALLRRNIWSGPAREQTPELVRLQAGSVSLNLVERTAAADGEPVVLTRLEFDLLHCLVRNKDRVMKRQELLDEVWHYPEDVETRTLDKHVETLRRKLRTGGALIQTVHGIGYRFLDPGSPLLPKTNSR